MLQCYNVTKSAESGYIKNNGVLTMQNTIAERIESHT